MTSMISVRATLQTWASVKAKLWLRAEHLQTLFIVRAMPFTAGVNIEMVSCPQHFGSDPESSKIAVPNHIV